MAERTQAAKKKGIVAVDLFCGAGGLTHGLLQAGIKVAAGIDADPTCQHPFEANNPGALFRLADIRAVTKKDLGGFFGNAAVRILAGCAPCQTFSTYSLNKSKRSDERWTLLNEFVRLVDEVRPEVVTMENVPRLRKHGVFSAFVAKLKHLGYKVKWRVVDCSTYGIPQRRNRLVLLASLLGDLELRRRMRGERGRTVADAIGSMTRLRAGARSRQDLLHTASELSEKNMKRIRASRPGGTWKEWDRELRAKCHQKRKGRTFPSVYGRMSWDEPSPTITTQFFGFGNGRFGHPGQLRALSLREGALLQTFPKDYSFVKEGDAVHVKALGRLIGNAVPVKLGRVIGESITAHVKAIPRGRAANANAPA